MNQNMNEIKTVPVNNFDFIVQGLVCKKKVLLK
jgi:hypothetical protein